MPSNVGQVIADIEDVKRDLQRNVPSHVASAMEALLQTAITHVADDAYWRGNLTTSLRTHGVDVEQNGDEYTISVGTDAEIAPYAPFVEFGTGSRTDIPGPTSLLPTAPDEYPPGFPYEAPSMSPGLVSEIIEWVETKPIVPRNDDMSQQELGFQIAATIVEKGTYSHPFLRPAWFKHVLNIKIAASKAVRKSFR